MMLPTLVAALACGATPVIYVDRQDHSVTIDDPKHGVELTLDTDHKCLVSKAIVRGRSVRASNFAACSGIKIDGRWITTTSLKQSPTVTQDKDQITLSGIEYGVDALRLLETWTFERTPEGIAWKIRREYMGDAEMDDTGMPIWSFHDMSTWTGARLPTGSVSWSELLKQPNATLCDQSGSAVLWNSSIDNCFSIQDARPKILRRIENYLPCETRYTREPDGVFTVAFHPTRESLKLKHGRERLLEKSQDVWQPTKAAIFSLITTRFLLQESSYKEAQSQDFLGAPCAP